MRILGFLIFCLAVIWLADMFFYQGRYGTKLWLELEHEAQIVIYEIRRWTKF